MFQFINDNIQPDLLLWTGDSISHNFYQHTPEEVKRKLEKVSEIIDTHFKGKTRVYPVMGNHDFYPLNLQDFDRPNDNPYIEFISRYWKDFIVEEQSF